MSGPMRRVVAPRITIWPGSKRKHESVSRAVPQVTHTRRGAYSELIGYKCMCPPLCRSSFAWTAARFRKMSDGTILSYLRKAPVGNTVKGDIPPRTFLSACVLHRKPQMLILAASDR